MATTFDTVLTKHGYETLYKSGLENNIVYYDIKDNSYIYGLKATEAEVLNVTGSHNQITSVKCAVAGYNGVFPKTPTTTEINNEISQVQINFVNENCSTGNFELPNINVNINLNSWFYGTNGLANTPYSTNMGGLILDISDYVKVSIQKLNLTTKNYEIVKYTTDLNVSWFTDSDKDNQNLLLVSPKYVNRTGTKKIMVDESNNTRFPSPFQIFHASYSPYGKVIQNTAIRLGLLPDEVGYLINGKTFLSCTEVETNEDPAKNYGQILPAFKINNSVYTLNEITPYPTTSGLVGYANKMVNSDGQNLINGLIEKAILFMKANGSESNGVYTIPINMYVLVTSQDINFINKKFGGKISINLIYDPNDTTSNVVNYI